MCIHVPKFIWIQFVTSRIFAKESSGVKTQQRYRDWVIAMQCESLCLATCRLVLSEREENNHEKKTARQQLAKMVRSTDTVLRKTGVDWAEKPTETCLEFRETEDLSVEVYLHFDLTGFCLRSEFYNRRIQSTMVWVKQISISAI